MGNNNTDNNLVKENIIVNVVLGIVALIVLIFIIFIIWYRFFKKDRQQIINDQVQRIPNPLYQRRSQTINESVL